MEKHSSQIIATLSILQSEVSSVLKFLPLTSYLWIPLRNFYSPCFVSLELFPAPVLKIDPLSNIYEGDHLNILCTTSSHVGSSREVHLDLSHGTKLLDRGSPKVNHSMIILAKDTQDFECRQKIDKVVKVTTKNISVTGECLCVYTVWFCCCFLLPI